MSVYHTKTSAANASSNPVIQHDVDPNFLHSGIRATTGNRSEIKSNSTTLPCQHCTNEINERNKRIPRIRLCYYCHLPGHHIYNCKAKDNDEATQLLKQAINVGIR
ncbi:putative transcription factor interactor and regulator CCHC(Zn) family [Helianthus annuus]|nr:putative transcription factor interactor and regulator CCHC(Zn) family [Helianthus annuus]